MNSICKSIGVFLIPLMTMSLEIQAASPSHISYCGRSLAVTTARAEFLAKISPSLEQHHTDWQSQFFSSAAVSSKARVGQILDALFSDSPESRELMTAIQKWGGASSARLWEEYFKAYDHAVLYSDGYQDLLWRAVSAFEGRPRVLDYGMGTGNFSAALMFAENRQLVGFDLSQLGVDTSSAKARFFPGSQSRFEKADLTQLLPDSSRVNRSDAAVMNNVLYAIPAEKKLSTLKQIFSSLRPGGLLFLNDPVPSVQHDPESAKTFLRSIAESAIDHGSRMSERDWALLAGVNRLALINPQASSRFLTPEQMRALVHEAGFEWVSSEPTYYHQTRLYILRKPKQVADGAD